MKNLRKYYDLYGADVTLTYLKTKFNFVSFRQHSEPFDGSLTKPTVKLKPPEDTKIYKVIMKRNGQIVVVTNYGWLKFVNL